MPTNIHNGHEVFLAEQRMVLLPEKAVFWPARSMLIVGDLHLGKDETFRRSAMPVPGAITGSDLSDLSALAHRLPCDRVMILGDLVHHSSSLGPRLDRELRMWRAGLRVSRVQVVIGNHDKHAGLTELPDGFELLGDSMTDGPFVFRHHPEPSDEGYVLAGHVHPVVVLRGRGGDKLRVPCFVETADSLTLPAFGSFTGGYEVERAGEAAIHAIAGRTVLRLPSGGRNPS